MENRNHERRATLQTAMIRFDNGVPIRTEIRDYCQTGLYVAFLEGHTPDAAILALVGVSVRMEFGVGDEAEANIFRLDGKVAHVSPTGVGVYVASMHEGALLALRGAGARLAQPESGRSGPDLSPRRIQTLEQECTSLFRGFLDGVMQDFLRRGAEHLREAAQVEQSFVQRSRYIYGAEELAQGWPRIQEDFFNAIRDRIHHVGQPPEASVAVSVVGELALVDEAEFEDWLNLSTLINQIEADITVPLNEFERRYGRLVDMPIDRKSNPFGPRMICLTFQGAIQGLDFSNPMRAILYKAFGHAIAQRAADLYRELNDALASLQLAVPTMPKSGMAKLESAPVPAAETAVAESSPAEGGKPKADLAEIADTLNKLYKQSQADISQAPENVEYSLDQILASLNPSHRRSPAPLSTQPGAGSAPGHGIAARPDVLRMVERLRQASRQLPGRADIQDQTAAGGQGAGGAALPEASLQEMLTALDGLPLAIQGGAGRAAAPALAEQVATQLAMAAGGGKRLAPAYQRVLDSTTSLFSQARAEFVPSSEVESLVKRLERTLLKLALTDESFPTNPDHPARQVVNLIDQFAVAADDKGKFFDARMKDSSTCWWTESAAAPTRSRAFS